METAAIVVCKSDRAAQLRTELQSLTKEVPEAQQKLNIAERGLASLRGRRRELAEAGKSGGIELLSKIADSETQVEILRNRIVQKRGFIDAATVELDNLEREIAQEARIATRKARFENLESQGLAACARIAEKIRALMEEDLRAFDAVRDSLAREYIHRDGVFNSADNDVEANAARALIRKLETSWMDGPFLSTERKLLREGWQVRGDIVLEIKNLRPPKK